MGKHSPVAIAPRYMETFQCIGSDCEENCCHGWRVSIDKPIFKKYRTVPIHALNEKMKVVVVKNETSSNLAEYAQIKLDAEGNCPFLDEKSLCEIQGQLGADYLSRTCQTYPRYHVRKDQELRLYASLSCPEAARKSLLDTDAMDMIQITLPYANDSLVPVYSSIRTTQKNAGLLEELSSYVAETAFHIIRAPESRAWDAMIVLGMLVRRIQRALAEQQEQDARRAMVDAMIDFTDADYLAQAHTLAHGITVERSKQIALLRAVLSVYFAKNHGRTSYRKTIADAMEGIGFDETDLQGSEARYNEAEGKWFAPFDDAHPHLLKNYLLNDMGKNTFPLGTNRGLEKEFIDLAMRFSLIKMSLVGIAGLKKENFSADDYVRVIYTFSRNIEHNTGFMSEIMALLEQDGFSNIAAATLMLR